MWTLFKAIFYLSIFTFGLLSFTGSVTYGQLMEMKLTKHGIRWTVKESTDSSKIGKQGCTYDVKMESKFKDMKEPTLLKKGFFDANNIDMSVTAECAESHFSKEEVKDVPTLMVNYDDLTYARKVIVDHRVKAGYYKTFVVQKTKLPYPAMASSAWEYGRIAYAVFFVNRVLSLLYKRFVIGDQQEEAAVDN